jgi:hypothetical protein
MTRALFAPSSVICFCADCDYSWWHATSAASTIVPSGAFPTLQCGQEEQDGYLLGESASGTLFLTSTRDRVVTRQGARVYPVASIPLGSVAIVLANGVPFVQLNTGPIVRLRAHVSKRGELLHDSTRALWASADWIVSSHAGGVEAMRPGSAERHLLTTHTELPAHISACGSPLQGDVALAFDMGSVVGVPLSPSAKGWWVRAPPLTKQHCLAATNEVLVVSGQQNAVPALALFSFAKPTEPTGDPVDSNMDEPLERTGFWEVLLMPWTSGMLEPRFVDGSLVVSAPEESVTDADTGRRVRAAGALYTIHQQPDGKQPSWSIGQRVVAPTPRRFGLFGFQAVADPRGLWINHLVDGAKEPEEFAFGTPRACLLSEWRAAREGSVDGRSTEGSNDVGRR